MQSRESVLWVTTWYGFYSPSVWISSLQSFLRLIEKSDTVLGCYRQCKIGHLVLCLASIWGQLGWGDIRALWDQSGSAQWPEKTQIMKRGFACWTSRCLWGWYQSAHHFKVINSWSPRSDCSLALRSATTDMRAWMYLCSRSSQPPLFLLPIVQHLSSFCCTFQPPVPCSYSWFGVAHWKGAKAHATTKWKGEEMFWHSPGPSSPLCYTGIAEGWCPGEDWEVLGERCRSRQGGNI